MEHLAIMDKKTINDILSEVKKIESRFSKNNITPFNKVKIGDIVYLKEGGKKVCAMFTIKDIIFYDNLNPQDILNIKDEYNELIHAPNEYWNMKKESKYGTLMFIDNPCLIDNFSVCKKNRQGFISVNKIDNIKSCL